MTARLPALAPVRQTAMLCALALLGACASLKDPQTAPEQTNYTPFAFVLLQAQDSSGSYWSTFTKLTYDIDADGTLTLADVGEPPLKASDDPAQDRSCQPHGGGENQRTSWFPYTGLFVRGGEVLAVKDARGAARPLRSLSADSEGRMKYAGPHAREPEYTFVPCVGAHRVDQGHRLDSYLPDGARLRLKAEDGRIQTLALPSPDQPFLMLRYKSGAVIPVPMRPVLVSVDLQARRLVVQYQSTFSANGKLREIEYRFVTALGEPSEGESAAHYRQRTDALVGDLRQCPPPTLLPRESCGDPAREPDRKIFD
ncbi:hypothetical protein [Pseudomonas sp. RIT-PI-AD]|uniref:hypothetical protein n=1 Tax=Pseudomonas sp. RIT-PI-AD TaxID=3035294 RepID=UPI0021DAE414|nr:hypothetical protein [Pseudomonas sp. RIT-PI-AD]